MADQKIAASLISKQPGFGLVWIILTIMHIAATLIGTYTEDHFGDVMIGGMAFRAPYELLIFLAILLSTGREYTPRSLLIWYPFVAVLSHLMLLDWLYFQGVALINQSGFASISVKPQEGVTFFAGIAILALIYRLFWRRTLIAMAHLALLVFASGFLFAAHYVLLQYVGKPMEVMSLRSLSNLVDNQYFQDYCQDEGYACYEGPYQSDSNYPLVLKSDLHPFVYSQFVTMKPRVVNADNPDNGNRLGGVLDINGHARDQEWLLHAWSTGWLDVSNIDQPVKNIVYSKDRDRVRIMVDYYEPIHIKNHVMLTLRCFLTGFSYIWIICGILLILKHASLPRFRRKNIGA